MLALAPAPPASAGVETMHPGRNPYARPPWQHRRVCRLEQVFYRGAGLVPGPGPPALCLNDPPVSDHFGLAVTLTLGG